MYAAEFAVEAAAANRRWTDGGTGERIARQVCRELLLLEASDWPTLITTGAARDYAERRFSGHADRFAQMLELWKQFVAKDELSAGEEDAAARRGAARQHLPGTRPGGLARSARLRHPAQNGQMAESDGALASAAVRELPAKPRSALALWHLLSLDAPCIAALWTIFIARSFDVPLPWTAPLALALAVWMLYAADRLADAAAGQSHEERHRFHQRHRVPFAVCWLLCAPVLLWLVAHLPHALRDGWLLLAIPLAAYVGGRPRHPRGQRSQGAAHRGLLWHDRGYARAWFRAWQQ